MNTIKTYPDKSQIHGIGLFAAEFIPKGTLVWQFNPLLDKMWTKEEYQNLNVPPCVRFFLKIYTYYDESRVVLCGDNARFTNHSENPNCEAQDFLKSVAIRDIAIGEEMTENYDKVHAGCWNASEFEETSIEKLIAGNSELWDKIARSHTGLNNQELDELHKLEAEYNKLLRDEYDEVLVYAATRGWVSQRYERGKWLRESIAELKGKRKYNK